MSNNVLPDPLNTDPVAKDYWAEVRQGNVPGHRIVLVRGRNPQVSSVSFVDLWDPGGVRVDATAGEQLTITTNSANDDIAGTGAQVVEIGYLDDNYVRQTTTVNLVGSGSVNTTETDILRVEYAQVIQTGSTIPKENEADIDITSVVGGYDRGQIAAGNNRTLDGHYTVPAGTTAYIVNVYTEINKNEDVVVEYKATIGTDGIYSVYLISSIYQNNNQVQFRAGSTGLVEKSDFKQMVKSTNAVATPSLLIEILEVDD